MKNVVVVVFVAGVVMGVLVGKTHAFLGIGLYCDPAKPVACPAASTPVCPTPNVCSPTVVTNATCVAAWSVGCWDSGNWCDGMCDDRFGTPCSVPPPVGPTVCGL
jgi:hypothetical protein